MDEKYQRVRVLGKGAFGKAYLVKNTERDELCVVKQIETLTMGKKEKEEAVKEAMLLKRMDHNNIVRFQEVFMTRKGRLCIVMDYADAGDVHSEIKRRDGQLIPEAQILEWFVQVCFALKHVHDRKVLHRDIKTQNIFLMSTGQVKLGDFGIAKVLEFTEGMAKTMVGTPYYLSPELIEEQPYNAKSDVWSLGVVLYEMTTLKHPFDADSLVVLASKILRDQYPPPDAMYSEDLQTLIRSMLSKAAVVRPYVKDILTRRFLRPSMEETNARHSLGVDLASIPCEPPTEALGSPAGSPLARDGTPTSPAEAKRPEGEDEYDEDFEDYSEPEDDDQPQNELQQSVANLKLSAAPGAAAVAGPTGGAGPSAVAEPGLSCPVANPAAESGSKVGAKADALRAYLRSQVPDEHFAAAYALVRGTGDTGAEELQRQVGEVIGADKAPELFTLFQLLCFLEDVSSNPDAAAQQ